MPSGHDAFLPYEGGGLADTRGLAAAVEDKLKLAPILARRLERVSHSSGSFSSRVRASGRVHGGGAVCTRPPPCMQAWRMARAIPRF